METVSDLLEILNTLHYNTLGIVSLWHWISDFDTISVKELIFYVISITGNSGCFCLLASWWESSVSCVLAASIGRCKISIYQYIYSS